MVALALVAGHTQWSVLLGSNNLVFLGEDQYYLDSKIGCYRRLIFGLAGLRAEDYVSFRRLVANVFTPDRGT